MCGIAGFFDKKGHVAKESLIAMTDALQHRGPDGKGYFFENNTNAYKGSLGLGHRRLSILDLSTSASQPMSFNELVIVFNGEVYNYKEIRAELLKLGYSFETTSDTEVILKAFHKWGQDCVKDFIGMFSFVIYDSNKSKLYLCRDRAGVKPLYYSNFGGSFLFASELKSFFSYPNYDKRISQNSVALYFKYGYIPTPYSIFENTFKLDPGSWLIYDIKTGETQNEVYWTCDNAYQNKHIYTGNYQDAISYGEDLIRNACEYRMISDVPVGVFLSGGYDSTLITSLLQTTRTERLKTFTIGFNEAEYNEAPHAKKIASLLGTDHTEYYCSTNDVVELLPMVTSAFDEPFADNSVFPTLLVSKLARESVTVALSADAGDEIFAGYNKYDQFLTLRSYQSKFPSFFFGAANRILDNKVGYSLFSSAINHSFAEKLTKASAYLKSSSAEELLDNISTVYSSAEVKELLIRYNDDVQYTPFIKNESIVSDFSRMLNVDYKTYLRDDILVKVDRCGMAVSLEGREPLLDHRILEWAATLPKEYKYDSINGKKKILKAIVHKYVPKDLMDRPKMGFGMPIKEWLAGDFKKYLDEFASEEFVKKQSIFDYGSIGKYIKRFKAGDTSVYMKLWLFLMFQFWYKRWITNI